MIKEKTFFLLIVFLSALSCLERADYNLPLFIFAYVLWDFRDEKIDDFINTRDVIIKKS